MDEYLKKIILFLQILSRRGYICCNYDADSSCFENENERGCNSKLSYYRSPYSPLSYLQNLLIHYRMEYHFLLGFLCPIDVFLECMKDLSIVLPLIILSR